MNVNISCSDEYRTYQKFTDVTDLSPSQCFVLIDTLEQDIQDATFGIFSADFMWANYWLDVPADRHLQGANISFVDGHVEHWKWQARKIKTGDFTPAYSDGDLADLQRLETCVRLNSY